MLLWGKYIAIYKPYYGHKVLVLQRTLRITTRRAFTKKKLVSFRLEFLSPAIFCRQRVLEPYTMRCGLLTFVRRDSGGLFLRPIYSLSLSLLSASQTHVGNFYWVQFLSNYLLREKVTELQKFTVVGFFNIYQWKIKKNDANNVKDRCKLFLICEMR